MKCEKIEVQIFLYNELTTLEKEKVDVHVQTCATCRALVEQVNRQQQLIQQVAAMPIEIDSRKLTRNIMSAIQPGSKSTWLDESVDYLLGYWTRLALVSVSVCLIVFFTTELLHDTLQNESSLSKVKQDSRIQLNTKQFLQMQWKQRTEVSQTASWYDCLKQKDCLVIRNYKSKQANENI